MASKESNSPPSLFSEEEMALEKVGSPVFTGASTGERLKDQRPDLYRIVVQLLGQGSGVREIMRITGLHNKTIAAVREREGVSIDTLKKVHAAGHSMVVELGIELTEEAFTQGTIHGEPVKLKLGDIAMATKLHFDMKQILTGGVTARVEKVEIAQVAAGLERMLDDLPVIDAEYEEVSGTNPVGGNTSPIAALLDVDPDAWMQEIAQVDADPAAVPVCEIAPDQFDIQAPLSDGQSVVSDSPISVETPIASNCASNHPKKSAPKAKSTKTKAALVKSPATAPKSKAGRAKQGGRGSGSKPRAKIPD
jgi:hypothetical protein